ncbi:uncharacterized protein [Ptychodera flava]|uniref:uncharacterized protein n=1 Tax=Ptychodera flava TaxID=63121 RepID=UPI00396A0EAA
MLIRFRNIHDYWFKGLLSNQKACYVRNNHGRGQQHCMCLSCIGRTNELIRPFSEASWAKFIECVEKWKSLDGLEKEVAMNFSPECQDNIGFHVKCYRRFTDKCRIAQAVTRIEKGRPRLPVPHVVEDECNDSIDKETEPPAKRSLRSATGSHSISGGKRRSVHVLPPMCLICRSVKRMNDRKTGKRIEEKLTSCETGESLLKAAEVRQDEELLVQIRGQDLVSIEVKYHKSCYRNYTRCLEKPYEKKDEADSDVMYTPSFKILCTNVIEKRIFDGGEVLRMTALKNLFVKIISDTEHYDASTYRNTAFKKRLVKKYGDRLQFIRPHFHECELVLAQTKSRSQVLNITPESESEDEIEQCMQESTASSSSEVRDIFHAAMQLHDVIQSADFVSEWPPKAEDVTLQRCQEVVPVKLFNFLAWCTGASTDFCPENYVKVSDDAQNKLLSIGQDLIYLSSKGRKTTPKHVALGMAVRHLTGSSSILGLLNGLGHCTSHSQILQHDTALAIQQLQGNGIPPGFQEGVFTTLVWDNNDFGEETLTGKGTTHNTNGIILQRMQDEVSSETQGSSTSNAMVNIAKSKQRTLTLPPSDIIEYHGKPRHGPAPPGYDCFNCCV